MSAPGAAAYFASASGVTPAQGLYTAIVAGFFIALLGVIFGIVIFIMTRIYDNDWGANGVFALFSIAFIFMGGQFAAMGLLGEYIGKIHLNARGRPQFFVEKVTGTEEK